MPTGKIMRITPLNLNMFKEEYRKYFDFSDLELLKGEYKKYLDTNSNMHHYCGRSKEDWYENEFKDVL